MRQIALNTLRHVNKQIGALIDSQWYNDPLVKEPPVSPDRYKKLWEDARGKVFETVKTVEKRNGYAIDRDWIDDLALHTQIVIKESELCYQHGHLLYTTLRHYLEETGENNVTILETGTARGFSAIVMSKALRDHKVNGRIVTVDILPHDTPMYWNCIDDHDGRKSRAQLLRSWKDELSNIVFLQGDTRQQIKRLGFERVHFAFLDAAHTYEDVMLEVEAVLPRQAEGDVIFFDDYTPAAFPGVVKAVDRIAADFPYELDTITVSAQRGYAVARRTADT